MITSVTDTLLDLADLRDSWLRQLRGQRKSIHTQRGYQAAIDSLLTYCDEAEVPRELTKPNVLAWLGAQTTATSTVRLRLTAIKLFARWLAEEEGFDPDPITTIKPPKKSDALVSDLSEDEVMRMVTACDGTTMPHKRDRAMILLFGETGARASELLGMDMDDIDLDACMARLIGKGGKPRRVHFSPGTSAAIDRYVRARKSCIPRPAEGPLWISTWSNRRSGKRLSYTGLSNTLRARAAAAGVIGFHIHRLRHTAAVRWLRRGGTEMGLRAHCGWDDSTMISRYAKAASAQLAAEEFDRLGLGLSTL